MFRTMFATALAVLAVTAFAAPGEAGARTYYMCWSGLDGRSECVNLPRNYRLSGLDRPSIPFGTTAFVMTRPLIRQLGRYVDTEGMRPAYQATIYAPKYLRGGHRTGRFRLGSRRRGL